MNDQSHQSQLDTAADNFLIQLCGHRLAHFDALVDHLGIWWQMFPSRT